MLKLEDLNILVIGDIMLDKYLIGSINRLSPEAPVPIIEITNQETYLGGCGNAAKNISSLGVKTTCMAVVGDDLAGVELSDLTENNLTLDLKINKDYSTIQKYRLIENNRNTQVVRYDIESVSEQHLNININDIDSKFDAILISYYGKGTINQTLMNEIRKSKRPVIVDPKIRSDIKGLYDGVFLIKPNDIEFSNLPSIECEYILRTMGSEGMILYDSEDREHNIKSNPIEVYNVCGAGDTVAAVLTICIAMGFGVLNSAQIASRCAEYVITKAGTASVDPDVFAKALLSTRS